MLGTPQLLLYLSLEFVEMVGSMLCTGHPSTTATKTGVPDPVRETEGGTLLGTVFKVPVFLKTPREHLTVSLNLAFGPSLSERKNSKLGN